MSEVQPGLIQPDIKARALAPAPITPVEAPRPEAAPVDEEETGVERPEEIEQGQEVPDRQEEIQEPLPTELIFAVGALRDHAQQDMLQKAEHEIAEDVVVSRGRLNLLRQKGKKIIKAVWQNSLFRPLFTTQKQFFVADMRRELVRACGSGIPIELPIHLIEKAKEEAKKQRHGVIASAGWGLRDVVAGITGLCQTTEQKLAVKWLSKQLASSTNNPSGMRDGIIEQAILEQTALGDRFARISKDMTLEQANRLVLAQGAGETRHELADTIRSAEDPSLCLKDAASQKIKALILEFVISGAPNEAALVSAVNTYLATDFAGSLPDDLAKELNAAEYASNITTLARSVLRTWNRYQEIDEATGRSKWDDLTVRILFGKAEWGGVRGKVEKDPITERLASRLASRNAGFITKELARSTALADTAFNLATYAGAYTGGAVLTAAAFGANTLARTAGGSIAVAAIAGLRESGIPGLTKGNYQKEVEQASRERARGRYGSVGIRLEMEKALVAMRTASELTARLQDLAGKPELTNEEAQRLLVFLADTHARMTLTDISNTKGNRVQNYIKFSEGLENQEYKALKSTVLDSMVKLTASAPTFAGGQELSMDLFDKVSALAEARLQTGSHGKERGVRVDGQEQTVRDSREHNVVQALARKTGLTSSEARGIVTAYEAWFDLEGLDVGREESLDEKAALLQKLKTRRFAATAAKTLILGGVGSVVVQTFGGEFLTMVKIGWDNYTDGWEKVVQGQGQMPVRWVNGHVESAVSPFQQAVLMVHNIGETTADSSPIVHIKGADFKLNSAVRYQHNVTDGHEYRAFVDIRNGKVLDLTDIKFNPTENPTTQTWELRATAPGGRDITSSVKEKFALFGLDLSAPVVKPEPVTIVGQTPVVFPVNAQSFDIPRSNLWTLPLPARYNIEKSQRGETREIHAEPIPARQERQRVLPGINPAPAAQTNAAREGVGAERKNLTAQQVSLFGLQSIHEIDIEGEKVFFSDPYINEDDRIAVGVYNKAQGTWTARALSDEEVALVDEYTKTTLDEEKIIIAQKLEGLFA